MEKAAAGRKIGQKIWFIAFFAIVLYHLYLSILFFSVIIPNLINSGLSFYSRFPSVLWGGAVEYILFTASLITLLVTQFKYAINKSGQPNLRWIMALICIVLLTVSEFANYSAYSALFGVNYTFVKYLVRFASISGVIRLIIFVIIMAYLIYSLIKAISYKKAEEKQPVL